MQGFQRLCAAGETAASLLFHGPPWPASLFTEFQKVRGNLKPDKLSSYLLCVLDLLIHLTGSKFKITRRKTHFLWFSGDIAKDWCPFPGQVWLTVPWMPTERGADLFCVSRMNIGSGLGQILEETGWSVDLSSSQPAVLDLRASV